MSEGSTNYVIALLLWFEAKRQDDIFWKVFCYIACVCFGISAAWEIVLKDYLA